jgi:Big-like domain-containing protein
MANRGRSSLLWVTLAIVALFGTASLLVVGCNGFFIDPTLTSISVTPSAASISPCSAPVPGISCTVQLTATGTFNDGSTGPTTVTWTSQSPAIATVSTGGLVSGVAAGTATIQAASGSITPGSASISVCGVNTTSITITGPTTASLSSTNPSTLIYTARGSSGQDITTQVVWQSSSATVATIGPTTGVITQIVGTGTTNITATACGVTSNQITLTVTT